MLYSLEVENYTYIIILKNGNKITIFVFNFIQ
jgi:hypothetical protein